MPRAVVGPSGFAPRVIPRFAAQGATRRIAAVITGVLPALRSKETAMTLHLSNQLHDAARASAQLAFSFLFYGLAFVAGVLAIAGR